MTQHITARAQLLAGLAKANQWTRGVELGVYDGATCDHLLSSDPQLTMLGVDLWEPIEGGPKDKITGFSPKAADVIEAAHVKAEAVRRKHAGRLTYTRLSTQKAAELHRGDTFDFAFVDASHVTADVVADVRAWGPMIRPGGMMLGHDADWPAMQDALAMLYGHARDRVQYLPGNVWGVVLA